MKGARQEGFVLLGVLVLVMLISMVALSLMFRLRAEEAAGLASGTGEQAWSAAWMGVQEAMAVVQEIQPGATDWEDLPDRFKDRFVTDDGSDKWYFTVWSAADADSTAELRYGLTDEARKINVNAVGFLNITNLAGMTSAHAAALEDFVDFDDLIGGDGAEAEFYSALPKPYLPRNGALAAIDELALVRGFTPELLYGEDANVNLRLDPNEDDGPERLPNDNANSKLDLGLRRFLTVVSAEPDEDNDGVPRTDVNDPLDPLPQVDFPPAVTNFVLQLRASGNRVAQAADLLEATIKVKNATGVEQDVASEIGKEELPFVLDKFTVGRPALREGKINVNTAPIEVLTTVPGIDEPLAEAIASTRRSISPERRGTIAWLFQEDVVDAAKFKELAPHLTARSKQFSFHVAGYGVPSGRFRRYEVIIDSSETAPRVVYMRELTRLGAPFKLEGPAMETPGAAAFRVGKEIRG